MVYLTPLKKNIKARAPYTPINKMAEQKDKFPGGVRIFPRMDKQPDFVKGTITVSLNEFFKFCKDNPEMQTDYNGEKQLKMQILVSKQGKLYLSVDDFKKGEAQPNTSQNEDWTAGSQGAATGPAAGTPGAAADDLPF